MRVLIVNLRYRGGGAERCARELFHGLPTVGVDTTMWVGRRDGGEPAGVEGMQLPWERHLDRLEAIPFWTDWRHRGSARKIDGLQRGDFDVVHLHVIHSGCASIRAIHRLCQRLPVVWTFHDEWGATGGSCYYLGELLSRRQVKELTVGLLKYVPYHSYHDNLRFRGMRQFLGRWMPQPQSIVCPSKYMAELTRQSARFSESTIHTIPNGLSLSAQPHARMDRLEAKRSFGLDPQGPVVLLVAASIAEPRKGMVLAAEAIQRAAASQRVQTILLGRSTEALQRRLSGQRVVAAYAGDDATLARAYRAADVTLIPSVADNLPYVALESFACETPIVSFAVGGMPEIVGDNQRGILAPQISAEALGRSLQGLLDDSADRQQKGGNGRAWVCRYCDMTTYLRAIKNVYEESHAAFARRGGERR